ncbi:glycosyltransferase [Clostridium perfringens]|uniref:Capsular polysaccharide biosynthsis protein n=1 Tax=Clostridium perfringens E str. JGS1987 TaxID=451755 RepID=B1BNH9_CLOPF|nr:glycosyltransferase [Clostridium perfringens]EDT16702.1 capsular polysaccharide biosynthsis protein [Clostridium perfringens E str. JGS1987]EJT6558958.1 glycosyltransferase [Clostridium perfringens]EJT6560094.1 glycosyltransferase [Clostridium perfringens]MDK3223031.1 glycosyltransferase [Clostridium perfringens]MDM0833100.1 glycosyltransferase [Clostridium perfringens]
MKSILFMLINMNIGGTEKALINMLHELQKEKYKVTVLLLEKYGGFLDQIPNWVEVKYLSEYKNLKKYINEPPKKNVKELLSKKEYINVFNLFLSYCISKLKDDISYYYKYLLTDVSDLEEEYDIAVAYAGPMDFITYFVANKIRAKKRVQWIHFDISKIGFNKRFAENMYSKFDKIFVVSEEGKNKLNLLIPSLSDKTEVFFNIISSTLIKNMAENEEGFNDNYNGIRILTVGRLSREKGQDITISVLEKLIKQGYEVRWYCIGEGNMKKELEDMVKNKNLQENYILLGSKRNPYPFMKDCDIYVQSSRHEGYCITLAEARCFNNPIITTNFTGANEQIRNEKTGLIVNFNQDEMYTAIKRIIKDRELRDYIGNNLGKELIDTSREIEKFSF